MPMFTVTRSKELDIIPGMAELKAAMSDADSWMIIAPECNGSMLPTLNNAVAWLSMSGKISERFSTEGKLD